MADRTVMPYGGEAPRTPLNDISVDVLTAMDRQTPVYRQRMDRMSKWERRVVINLARLDCPTRLTDLAKLVRCERAFCATYLTRLKRKGIVRHLERRWSMEDDWLATWIRCRYNHGEPINPPDTPLPANPGMFE